MSPYTTTFILVSFLLPLHCILAFQANPPLFLHRSLCLALGHVGLPVVSSLVRAKSTSCGVVVLINSRLVFCSDKVVWQLRRRFSMDLSSGASCSRLARSLSFGVLYHHLALSKPIVVHVGIELTLSSPSNFIESGSDDDGCVVWLFCRCSF